VIKPPPAMLDALDSALGAAVAVTE
jgi:hypothetical protein